MKRKAKVTAASAAPPPGTERIVLPEGTVYHATPDGKRLLQTKKVFTHHTVSKCTVPTLRPFTAARDKSTDKWVTRLTGLLQQGGARVPRAKVDTATGRNAGGGYYIVATDGTRALCRRGDAPTPDGDQKPLTIAARTSTTHYVDMTDALALAVRRMKAVGSSPKHCDKQPGRTALSITVDAQAKRLTLSITDIDTQCTSTEVVPVTGKLTDVACAVNAAFLLDCCGVDGRLYLGKGAECQEKHPLMFDTADGEYRVLVMGISPEAAPAVAEVPVDPSTLPDTFEDSMYAPRADQTIDPKLKGAKRAQAEAAAKQDAIDARRSYDVDTIFEQRHWATLTSSTAEDIAALSPVERRCLQEAWYAHQRRRNWPSHLTPNTPDLYDALSDTMHEADQIAADAEHAAIAHSPIVLRVPDPDRHQCHFRSDENGQQTLSPPIEAEGTRWVFSDCNDDKARREGRRYVSELVPVDAWIARGAALGETWWPASLPTSQERYDSYASGARHAYEHPAHEATPEDLYNQMRHAWRADHLRGDFSLTRVIYRGVDYVVGPRLRMKVEKMATATATPTKSTRAKASAPPPHVKTPAQPAKQPKAAAPPQKAGTRANAGPAVTPCECCGQPTEPRPFAGRTRWPHDCPHGKPCPAGLRKSQRATGCQQCGCAHGQAA